MKVLNTLRSPPSRTAFSLVDRFGAHIPYLRKRSSDSSNPTCSRHFCMLRNHGQSLRHWPTSGFVNRCLRNNHCSKFTGQKISLIKSFGQSCNEYQNRMSLKKNANGLGLCPFFQNLGDSISKEQEVVPLPPGDERLHNKPMEQDSPGLSSSLLPKSDDMADGHTTEVGKGQCVCLNQQS